MRNSADGAASQWHQSSLVRCTIAAAVVGSGLLILGRSLPLFDSGLGGNGQETNSEVYVSDAHSERGLEQELQRTLALVNRDRQANGLPPLVINTAKTATVDATTRNATLEATEPSEPFREAVNAAMAAAVAAQTAQSPQDWAEVAEGWQQAIANMQAVAPEHPRHETAQQKVVEYGKNFDYARQNAAGAFSSQASADQADIPASLALASTTRATAEPPAEGNGSGNKTPNSISLDVDSDWSLGIKLLLTLGGAGLLIFILTLELDQPPDSEEKASKKRAPRKGQTQSQHRLAIEKVEQFLEERSWLNSAPSFSESSTASGQTAQRLHRKLYRELLSLAQDEQTAISLLKESMRLHPRQPVNWCCEQVIKDLRKNMPPAAPRCFRRAA